MEKKDSENDFSTIGGYLHHAVRCCAVLAGIMNHFRSFIGIVVLSQADCDIFYPSAFFCRFADRMQNAARRIFHDHAAQPFGTG